MSTAGGAASSSWALPPAVSTEIIRRYADILRVGRITLNGTEVRWDTGGATEAQLASFCEAFSRGLTEVAPDLSADEPAALRFAPYWVCKAVSINYALIEVVLMVKRRVGVLCTIETREDRGSGLVEYRVEVRPGNILCVSLIWRKADNIVYCDPLTAKRQVKGTLPSLETWFHFPPEEGFAPAYSFQLRLKRSVTQHATSLLTSALACGGPDRKFLHMETISIDEPLRSEHPFETFAELAALPREPPLAVQEAERLDQFEAEREPLRPRPCGLEAGSAGTLEELEALVGYLRVCVVRATGLDQVAQAWPDGQLTSSEDPETKVYATCSVAGRTLQTQRTSFSPAPEWREALHFPLKAPDLRDEVAVRLFMYNPRRGLRFWGRAAVPVSSALGVGSPAGDAALSPTPVEEGASGSPEAGSSSGGGGSGRLTARFDGSGGAVLVELELVPEAALAADSAASAAAEASPREASASSSRAAVGAQAAPSHSRRGVARGTCARTAARIHEEDEDECIVEVGTPLGVAGIKSQEVFPLTLGIDGFRIRVRGSEKQPEAAKSQGFWCTRPCTRDCG